MSAILAPFQNILTIDKTAKGSLDSFEKYSHITVNGIIASDRILQKMPYEKSVRYVSACCTQIKTFLADNNIDLVFGEVTWAHEMVTAGLCRQLDIPFLSPVNVRYPSDRFAFFEGVFQQNIIAVSKEINLSEGIKLYDRFINYGAMPFYMQQVRKPLAKKVVYHIKRYMTGDTEDMTVPSMHRLISKSLRKFFSPKMPESKPSGRYIYLPLQCTPESSIDIQAGYYMDQLNFVKGVARSIPADFKLAVKPHPLNSYSRRFYRELSKIPSVEIANAQSIRLIEYAAAVVSISSTACYEAGLCGIPAVVFCDTFYTDLPTVKRCGSIEKLRGTITDAIDAYTEENVVKTFLARLYSSSYEGFCESPDVYADALSSSNIYKVSKAFEEVVSFYSSSKSATDDSICSKLI
ncbi:MAG: hypothetical protein C0602_01035 [Denitrovibrio sp.]|nr:MAG: hypothetical protein C0602_01035 [Denitrovibrio sp.]